MFSLLTKTIKQLTFVSLRRKHGVEKLPRAKCSLPAYPVKQSNPSNVPCSAGEKRMSGHEVHLRETSMLKSSNLIYCRLKLMNKSQS